MLPKMKTKWTNTSNIHSTAYSGMLREHTAASVDCPSEPTHPSAGPVVVQVHQSATVLVHLPSVNEPPTERQTVLDVGAVDIM